MRTQKLRRQFVDTALERSLIKELERCSRTKTNHVSRRPSILRFVGGHQQYHSPFIYNHDESVQIPVIWVSDHIRWEECGSRSLNRNDTINDEHEGCTEPGRYPIPRRWPCCQQSVKTFSQYKRHLGLSLLSCSRT